MGSRVLAVAHAPTVSAHDARFAHPDDEVISTSVVPTLRRRIATAFVASERRCGATASALEVEAEADPAWDDLDVGDWAGLSLAEVVATCGEAELMRWLHDPAYDGHGGESVESLHARVGAALHAVDAAGITLVVTSPACLRALAVTALGAPTAAHRQISAGPLDAIELSRDQGPWNLVSLRPAPQWVDAHDVADHGDGGRS